MQYINVTKHKDYDVDIRNVNKKELPTNPQQANSDNTAEVLDYDGGSRRRKRHSRRRRVANKKSRKNRRSHKSHKSRKSRRHHRRR